MAPDAILIDGRSGSGKTELARVMAVALGAQLVRLDDVYPGWQGLEEGSSRVPGILTALRWQRWDWAASAAAEWHELDAERTIIVEGCGAVSRASRALASVAIWVDLDAATRKRRALARDGDAYAPHWDEWADQESRLIAREHPQQLADVVVHG